MLSVFSIYTEIEFGDCASYFVVKITDVCCMCHMYYRANTFNVMSDNPAILTIKNLRRVVPRLEVLLFTSKNLHHWSRQISRTCSNRPPRVSIHQPLCCLLPLVCYPVNIFSCEDSRKQKRIQLPWTIVWRYPNGIFLWLVVQPKFRSRNKKLCLSM